MNGFNVQFSNLISPIIESVANEMEGKAEVISTEHALFKIDQFNKRQTKPQQNIPEKPQQQNNIHESQQTYKFSDPEIIAMPDTEVRESRNKFTFTQCAGEETESSDSEDDNESVDSGYETDPVDRFFVISRW